MRRDIVQCYIAGSRGFSSHHTRLKITRLPTCKLRVYAPRSNGHRGGLNFFFLNFYLVRPAIRYMIIWGQTGVHVLNGGWGVVVGGGAFVVHLLTLLLRVVKTTRCVTNFSVTIRKSYDVLSSDETRSISTQQFTSKVDNISRGESPELYILRFSLGFFRIHSACTHMTYTRVTYMARNNITHIRSGGSC